MRQRIFFILFLFTAHLVSESTAQAISKLASNDSCVDQYGIVRNPREEWFVPFNCGMCLCNKGSVTCRTVRTACPKPPQPDCIGRHGGCCPTYDCPNIKCKDEKGIEREIGLVWVDTDPCQPNKCTDVGIRKTVNVCYILPPQPNPSCQLKSDAQCCTYWECRSCVENGRLPGGLLKAGDYWVDPSSPALVFLCSQNERGHKSSQSFPNWMSLSESDVDLSDNQLQPSERSALKGLRNVWPIRDISFYLEGFRSMLGNLPSRLGFPVSDERSRIQAFADRFNWSALAPFLLRDNSDNTNTALLSGEKSLQNRINAHKILSKTSLPLNTDSPSGKHQVAFKRTDPLATRMASLGHLISRATQSLVSSLNLPASAVPALPLLGVSRECSERFGSYLRPSLAPDCDRNSRYRTLDGSCNNLVDKLMGAAFTEYRRVLPSEYGDGISTLRAAQSGNPLPSARLVSSVINKRSSSSLSRTLLHMSVGQFLGHDFAATPISRGPDGNPLRCCDDFRAKLDLAMRSLTTGKLVLEEAQSMEPSLRTNITVAEMRSFSTLMQNLRDAGERIMGSLRDFTRGSTTRQRQPESPGTDDECAPILIPRNDPFYSRFGQICMEFARSSPAATCKFGSRQQLNQHSSYIDGSVIYGVKQESTTSLRTFQNGLLKSQFTKRGQMLLPSSSERFDGCNTEERFRRGEFCFTAGDGRVNEQILIAFHQTLWHREHNRIARTLKSLNPNWNDELLFQETKRIIVAELQHITYNEFLPALLPPFILKRAKLLPLTGQQQTTDYDSSVDATISNVFATAAYRFGHSEVSDFINKLNKFGIHSKEELSTLFFNPFSLYGEDAMDSIARGVANQPAEKVDTHFTEEISGKLFRGALPFGLDLVAINIQRGRDHGIPGYIKWREHCGLSRAATFDDLATEMDADVLVALKSVYSDVADVDIYVGALAERPFSGGMVGPTFSCLLADQFMRLKVGDRFWYEYRDGPGAFTPGQMEQLHKVTLARVLCNNIPELTRIQPRPLLMKGPGNEEALCIAPSIPTYNLEPWRSH